MKIILIRHAKVLIENTSKISASQMQTWVDSYNVSPIDTSLPEDEVVTLIKNAEMVLASGLSRTRDSLNLIDITPTLTHHLFDEAALPVARGEFLKLRPKSWLMVLRVMMLLGIGKNNHTFKDSKQRAKDASDYLIELSKEHDNVVLMGHGGMNWLMGKELISSGWECVGKSGGTKNWGYSVYEYEEKKCSIK